uniref:RRM domain-containing protein n=1 Tax=Falco tinnunculus TaxID=100819 RepID=A0A8C4XJN7_FALTI
VFQKTLYFFSSLVFSQHSLFLVFSKFGPLYSVRAHRNAAVAGPGYYAIIKFYSAGDASRAQRTCNGKRLFQKSPLKVCICARQKGFQQQVLGLNSNKCQQLANHYLGFNGWSSRIITLQNVSGFDGENEELGKTLQKQSVKYLCAVEVTLPNHGVRTRGVALGEADVENSEGTFWMQLEVSQQLSQTLVALASFCTICGSDKVPEFSWRQGSVQGLVSYCAMQRGILNVPLPSPLHTSIAFLPSVLSLLPAAIFIPHHRHFWCEHPCDCACGTAQVPAGLCPACCAGQGPDTALTAVYRGGLAHEAPVRVLPYCR